MAAVIWNSDIDVYNPHAIPLPVARNIAKYLNIGDLISFSQVSRNTYKTTSNPRLWIAKLKDMGCWETSPTPDPDFNSVKFFRNNFKSPLNCLDQVIKLPKLAKTQVISIWKCLSVFYDDLLVNKLYDRLQIFKHFNTPEDQAQILTNLIKFNALDLYDDTHEVARDKLNTILEMFENALLRELEIQYDIEEYLKARHFVEILSRLDNDQTMIDFFLQKTIFDDERSNDFFNFHTFDTNLFYIQQLVNPVNSDPDLLSRGEEEVDNHPPEYTYTVNLQRLDQFMEDLSVIFNSLSKIIDQIFPSSIPMMYKLCEELISNQLMELVAVIVHSSMAKKCYLELVPILYTYLTDNLVKKLAPSVNMGESYMPLFKELMDMMFETFTVDYIREEGEAFKGFARTKITHWKDSLTKREEQTVQNILKNVRVENKNDLLSSFRKVFTLNIKAGDQGTSSQGANTEQQNDEISQIEAKTKILSENIKSLNKIFSIELAMDILKEAKLSLHRLLAFREFLISAVRNEVYQGMQVIFISVVDTVGDDHVKSGFEKALEYLKTYDPADPLIQTTLGGKSSDYPLVLFTELINMADLIIQMIDIFYKEELINTRIVKVENSILNPSLQQKKNFEGLVDNYVADGLNIGIDLLMQQVDEIFDTYLKDLDYNVADDSLNISDGPTEACGKVIELLEQNIDLLVGCTDKSVVEVYQKEIVERLFQVIVKTLKKRTISVTGAMSLISDLNMYYEFVLEHIKTNRRAVTPLFQALKKVGNIYLISGSDSKSIGKLVSDLSKFNGIFTQEEIYEFVHKRADWLLIKLDVEKVMYGLSLGDCSIM